MRICHKFKGTNISVRAQFPVKIKKKKKNLYPVLHQAKIDRKKVVLVRDKLLIEGKLYEPNDDRKPKHTFAITEIIINKNQLTKVLTPFRNSFSFVALLCK